MKVSERWLHELVDISCSREELISRLTMAGLEVDGVEPVAGDFSGVVVALVVSVAPHPSADKLKICQVEGHPAGVLQVVCGAANVRPGLKVPFAIVGSTLPPRQPGEQSLMITRANLRGVDSNGMLCSAMELGIPSMRDGLWELPSDAPVGQDLRKWLDLDDCVIEVDLTPNRGDCLSLRGLAREVAALTGTLARRSVIHPVKAAHSDEVTVAIDAPRYCPRYVGRLIRSVNNQVSTPFWLQEKLRRSGVRCINPVVDITNYVMLEFGQPMHAFDFNKLNGKVNIRLSRAGERITLLDGQDIELSEGTLLIADDEAPLAMAGIMGGESSSVSGETRDVFLESAFFTPSLIAGKARKYGLHTDSSYRFERGVDFTIQEQAIERATELLCQITGGTPGPVTVRESRSDLPELPVIHLDIERIKRDLGIEPGIDIIKGYLSQLGFSIEPGSDGHLVLTPPPWRYDLRLEVDVLEEVARLYGYNRLPTCLPKGLVQLEAAPENQLQPFRLKERLASMGYREVVTYSFVDPAIQALLPAENGHSAIPVLNPISSEMSVMRTSLVPGLLTTAIHNINRQQPRVRIFETGLVFGVEQGQRQQREKLGILALGAKYPESWFIKQSQLIDFYDIKGDIESLLSLLGNVGDFNYQRLEYSCLHPGQSVSISCNGARLGWLGCLHPTLQAQLGLTGSVFLAELDINALKRCSVPSFSEISRYPEIRRDLALVVDRDLAVSELLEMAKSAGGTYLTNLKVFDVYSGEGIDTKRKSVGLGLTFQAKSRTLTESEITECVDRVVDSLSKRFAAELRS